MTPMQRGPLTPEEIIQRGYRKPLGAYVSCDEAPDLYAAEERLSISLTDVMKELGRTLKFGPMQRWTHAAPETLLSVLQSFDSNASTLAAVSFLELQGLMTVPIVMVIDPPPDAA